jgi:hypothetical protein
MVSPSGAWFLGPLRRALEMCARRERDVVDQVVCVLGVC